MFSNVAEVMDIVNTFIPYPRLQELENAITCCHYASRQFAVPECLFIYGPSGVGKTALCKNYASRYPGKKTEDGMVMPVLLTSVQVSIGAVVSNLLFALGDPTFERGNIGCKTQRLFELLKRCKVELIILDKAQHLIDLDSNRIIYKVSDWLKMLIDCAGIPVIMIGSPEAVAVLESNPQLNRRFANRQMAPFTWDGKNESSSEFRSFLSAVESTLPLKEKSNLADMDMAPRIYYATDGLIRDVMRLIRDAVYLAFRKNCKRLDREMLGKAFERQFFAQKSAKVNPFYQDSCSI